MKTIATKESAFRPSHLALALLAVLLSACGSGGGGSTNSSSGTGTSSPSSLSGVVAVGAALAGATVQVTDTAGKTACDSAASSLTTSASGQYSCVLVAGETAPFLIVASDTTGNFTPMLSVATTMPAAGASATVNVSPLTTIIAQQAGIVATANATQLIASVLSSYSAILANVLEQLATVAASLGLSNYDPVTTALIASFSGQAGNSADTMLDLVTVATDPVTNAPVFRLVDGTGSSTIPVATATTSNPATLPAPKVPATELGQLSSFDATLAAALNTCFSGTNSAQRVTSQNTSLSAAQGGPAWTALGSACQTFGNLLSGGGAVPAYLDRGFSGPQAFLGLLTTSGMDVNGSTSARFQAPLVMQLRPAGTSGNSDDMATINVLYSDAGGNPGEFITTASYIGGQWALTGDQASVDVNIRTRLRMVTELNSANLSGAFSHYQTGLSFWINALGPGSGYGTSAHMVSAIVTGPGLPGYISASSPGTGVALIAPDPVNESGQTFMDVTSSIASTVRCGAISAYNCDNYWLTRTQNLTSASLASNPISVIWDQSGNALADSQAVVAGAQYTVTLNYSDGSTKTVTKSLLNDLQQAGYGMNVQWNSLGPKSTALMIPTGGLTAAQASATVDWVLNPLAAQVNTVFASISANGTYGLPMSVPKGATSVVYNPSVLSGTVESISALAAGSSARYLMVTQRTLNSSMREQAFMFDQ